MSIKIEDKLFLDRFKVDEESHLKIKDNAVCKDKCQTQACLIYLPGICLPTGGRPYIGKP